MNTPSSPSSNPTAPVAAVGPASPRDPLVRTTLLPPEPPSPRARQRITLVQRVRRGGSASLDSFLTDPDERVVHACLVTHGQRLTDRQWTAAVERAVAAADQRREWWNPILDALYAEIPDYVGTRLHYVDPRLDEIVHWLVDSSADASDATLDQFTDFAAPCVGVIVLSYTRRLTLRLLDLALRSARGCQHLQHNRPALQPHGVLVAHRCLAELLDRATPQLSVGGATLQGAQSAMAPAHAAAVAELLAEALGIGEAIPIATLVRVAAGIEAIGEADSWARACVLDGLADAVRRVDPTTVTTTARELAPLLSVGHRELQRAATVLLGGMRRQGRRTDGRSRGGA